MLRALIVKEFKDLIRNPQILLGFIISAVILPLMGFAMAFPMRQASQQFREPITVGIIDLDNSVESRSLIAYLNRISGMLRINVKRLSISVSNVEELKPIVKAQNGIDVILVIPKGFSDEILHRTFVKIRYLVIIKSLNFFGGRSARYIVLNQAINEYIGSKYLNGTGLDLAIIKNPTIPEVYTFLERKDLFLRGDPSEALASIAFAGFIMPFIVLMISITVVQMAATSMAIENEEKTLETLLTLPIPRIYILMAKLLGSFIVSLLGSLGSIAGFVAYLYIYDMAFRELGAPSSVSFTPLIILDPNSMAYILASFIITLFFMAALGSIIGALSGDTRVASTIVGPLVAAIMIPGMITAFIDVGSLSPLTRALVFSIPVIQTNVVVKEAITGNLPPELPLYMLVSLIFSLALLVLTAKIFSMETLLRLQRALLRFKKLGQRGRRIEE
ncbi:MAG: hypothetical protein DRJ59_06740 [Thermoprotei archaeon]|mgnify:CR=1 FL=1|nr:MAG: hypothetical protein DRJ59_06740 [Thermoprotei archaeon]